MAGVGQVTQVRSRGPANDVYLDLVIEVAGPMTADQTASIAREICKQLRQRFEGLRDIQIAFLPQKAAEPDYALVARAEGDALGIGVHEVIASTTPRGLVLEMHVEVAPDQTVGAAHQLVTQFEERLQRSVPGLARVVTHIEPAHSHEYVPTTVPLPGGLPRMPWPSPHNCTGSTAGMMWIFERRQMEAMRSAFTVR